MNDADISMLIGADRVDSNKPIDVLNPRTEALIGQVFEGSWQMDNALLAAKEGFSALVEDERCTTENADSSRYADLLEQHRERLVELLMEETGKPRENAEYDFRYADDLLTIFCGRGGANRSAGSTGSGWALLHCYVQRQPLG